jgi:hypothetical protein
VRRSQTGASISGPERAGRLAISYRRLFIGILGVADRIEDEEQSFRPGNLTHQADFGERLEFLRLDIMAVKQSTVAGESSP